MREAHAQQAAAHTAARRAHGQPVTAVGRGVQRWLQRPAPVTLGIIGVTLFVGVLQLLMPTVTRELAFWAPAAIVEPWRLATVVLVHGGLLHILFNMLTLYLVGPSLEQRLGKLPFLGAYIALAIAGDAAVTVLSPMSFVVGASGAIFGLFGMYIGLQRTGGGRIDPQLLILVGVNLAIGFFAGGVSWQAHVGGLIAGIAAGFGIGWVERRSRRDGRATPWLVIGGVALVSLVVLYGTLTLLILR